jgi:hypothetical protein
VELAAKQPHRLRLRGSIMTEGGIQMADGINGAEKMSVLNPVGFPPKITPKPMAPRLESLDGKTIYLVDPRFDDSGLFLRQVQEWFTDHMPSVNTKLVEMSSVYTKDDPKTWEMIKTNGDGAIIGAGH